jgi:PPIC-type PPIASE domain
MRSTLKTLAVACMVWAAVCSASHAQTADPTEQEMRAEYDRRVALLGSHEYRTRHIMVPTRDEAVTALAEVNQGTPFSSVATKRSRDSGSAARGGDLGWMLVNDVTPEFRVAFRSMETGLFPSPVRTPFGWHLILIDEVRQLRVPRFEDERAKIEAMMKKTRASAATATAAAAAPVPVAAKAIAAWTAAQWDEVFAAAEHTAGISSFVYREASFSALDQAQRATNFGIPGSAAAQRARHLIDLEPDLRFALTRLYSPKERSQPVLRLQANGPKSWTVLELISRDTAIRLQPNPQFQADAAVWVAKGHLPGPDRLTGDPLAMARNAYWRVLTLAQINAVPAQLSADVEYGNLNTPLMSAMLQNDLEAARALVQRGASVNRCGVWGCPIGYAARMEDPAKSLLWVDWLLKAGAKPDAVDPRGHDLFSTALGGASFNGHAAVARRLVEAGASVNGVAGGLDTPIENAALKGNRTMVEWLMASGASVLPLPDRGYRVFGHDTLYKAALESRDPAFIDWAGQTMLRAALQSPAYSFSVQFEQDGKRLTADAAGAIRLKAAPFKMVFRLPDGVEGVQVGASFKPAWLDEFRKTDLRNAMFRPFASAAQAEAGKPDSQDLFTMQPCPAVVKPDDGCDGSHMFLNRDPAVRDDFHERRTAGGAAYVRDVRTLFDTSAVFGPPTDSVALEKFAGQTLYVVMGVPLGLGGPTGLRLVKPQTWKLQFAR